MFVHVTQCMTFVSLYIVESVVRREYVTVRSFMCCSTYKLKPEETSKVHLLPTGKAQQH